MEVTTMTLLADDQSVAQRIFDHIDNRTTDRSDACWREPVKHYRCEQRKEPAHESPNHAPLQPMFKAANTAQPLLPQMQSSAVVEINPQEMKTKEPVQPFSVTEDSTSLLNNG
jgi:hypothetical protein